MVLLESGAPLRKITLCEELRDRFEPRVAEAVRAKRVTDTVSGLCVTFSSKASNSMQVLKHEPRVIHISSFDAADTRRFSPVR